MAIKLVDELKAMGNFPIAHAEGINLVKTDGTEDNLQNLFDNGELGGGDDSTTLTQTEYEALSEEQKLDGLYYTYDTKRIYKNGVQYGASDAEDIGYNNAESGIQATTVQGAIDKVVKTVEDDYAKKTDIPTTLPANGGNANTVNNHTVKSDVPENAVFTDTIYDDTELNAKLNGKADKNAVLNSLEIVNGYTTAQIIPWNDGTHYRSFEDKSSNTYTDIVTNNGIAIIARTENGVMTKNAELATMDKVAHEVDTSYMSNGILNILAIKESLGNGCYEIMGQGSAGHGSIRLNIWQVVSGVTAFSCCITDSSGVRGICGNEVTSTTVDVGTSYFATTNKIIKIF